MTYSDECLARAEKASPEPWDARIRSHMDMWSAVGPDHKGVTKAKRDAEFITAARTDVPELARRLKRAIEELRFLSLEGHRYTEKIIKELEAPLDLSPEVTGERDVSQQQGNGDT